MLPVSCHTESNLVQAMWHSTAVLQSKIDFLLLRTRLCFIEALKVLKLREIDWLPSSDWRQALGIQELLSTPLVCHVKSKVLTTARKSVHRPTVMALIQKPLRSGQGP